MKKVVKILLILILICVIFFTIDYIRAKNNQGPIFCIRIGILKDGGTKEYWGTGYKVIDFNRLSGYDEVKIVTWFMDYNDFTNEYEEYEKQQEILKLPNKVELMYETIIEHIMNQDSALNHEAEYISIDVNGFVAPIERGNGTIQDKYMGLTDEETQTILEYCKKYNRNVKNLSMKEIQEQGLFDQERMGIDGVAIYISDVEKCTENSAIMEMTKYRSALGAIFVKYKLEYKNDVWDIEVLQMAIS